jgi:cytochrome oxidase Cu insertion factor (SCO1/SenC/PrrC family)
VVHTKVSLRFLNCYGDRVKTLKVSEYISSPNMNHSNKFFLFKGNGRNVEDISFGAQIFGNICSE